MMEIEQIFLREPLPLPEAYNQKNDTWTYQMVDIYDVPTEVGNFLVTTSRHGVSLTYGIRRQSTLIPWHRIQLVRGFDDGMMHSAMCVRRTNHPNPRRAKKKIHGTTGSDTE